LFLWPWLDRLVGANDDAAMLAVLSRRCALAALVVVVAVAGCRDRARPAGGAAAGSGSAAPADEPVAWPAVDDDALVALQATERFELGSPTPLAITADGAVLFRRAKARDRVADLYQLDAAGKVTLLASANDLLTRKPAASSPPANPSPASAPPANPPAANPPAANPPAGAGAAGAGAADPNPVDAGAGIETVQLSDYGARILVPLAGRVFVVERATGAARELAITPFRDPQLSPDGKRVAFARGGDLWVATIGEAQPTRIAQHPADDPGVPAREYATADGAARSFGRDRGFWWSPDSQSIAFERSDARAVEPSYLADPRRIDQPAKASRIPRAGKAIPAVDLGVVSARGGAPRWVTWDLARYPYLARVVWPAKGPLTLIVVAREQTVASVVTVDAASGATHPVLVDKDPAWVNIVPDGLAWLPDGSGFLWMTQGTTAWTLEHHAADGAHVGTVTTADFGVRRIAGFTADGHDVIVEGGADPREQHVWRAALAGGSPQPLTTGGGVHSARVAHGIIAIHSQLRAGGREAIVIRPDGTRATLPGVAERPARPATTKLETIALEDHGQYTAVTRPDNFDPKLRYPVILRIGTAPDATSVVDASDTYALDQWYADGGFIVVRSDGRGPVYSDRSWNHALAGDLLTIPMNDQIGAVRRLRGRYPELDRGRTGALGGEFGGYLAAVGALIHPDAFAAAVAVSPIIDWQLVDGPFAERYLKTPAANPDAYRRTSALTYASQLTRPLLLFPSVPGSRVATAHAFALIDAVSAAGKHAEIATLPDAADAAHRIAACKLVLDFFRKELGPPVRPGVMPTVRIEDEDDEDEERERAQRAGSGSAATDKDNDHDRH
jgi:dipeptidyl-peptidase 4